MRAELVLMGKRVDMAARIHRRVLVVLIYACFAVLMTTFWLLDRWRTSGVYMIFATFLVNRFFLGGYNFGGLIKPFNGKAPRRSDAPPPFLMLALRIYKVQPQERECRNDERELEQRDRAHYHAYQILTIAIAAMWLIADWQMKAPRLLGWIPVSPSVLLYGFVLSAAVAAITLPQAILLWTEPDMEVE
ncbi:MAG TPA: hypothetical protein VGI45_11965 [Terracidiphilus sp.]|jgi:hypothetical protein